MITATETRTTWGIDAAHSSVEFRVRHMMLAKVRGRFTEVSGTVEWDESELGRSSVQVTIPTASIDTSNEQRDQHLRSGDFFDVENHDTITFHSRRVEGDLEGRFSVVGDLSIRGTTREVVLEVESLGAGEDPWGMERRGFRATTTIDRRDFGLTWNQALEAGGVLVGTDVEIELDMQVVRQ